MITDKEEFNAGFADVWLEFKYRILNTPKAFQKNLTTWSHVCDLGKPIRILTNNSNTLGAPKLEDHGAYFTILFPRLGALRKSYKDDFAWIADEDSILFVERPFKNRVVKVLKKLLPHKSVFFYGNDILLGGCKIGPTIATGEINPDKPEDSTGGIVYLLRWTNAAGLDEYFAGDINHEKRKASKAPLSSLDLFLPKEITRDIFIKMLEEEP